MRLPLPSRGATRQVPEIPSKYTIFPARKMQAVVGEAGLDSGGPIEPLCSELEWELIELGTGGGAPHPDMPGLYRAHPLPSRPATPMETFAPSQSEREVSGEGRVMGEYGLGLQRKRNNNVCERLFAQLGWWAPMLPLNTHTAVVSILPRPIWCYSIGSPL